MEFTVHVLLVSAEKKYAHQVQYTEKHTLTSKGKNENLALSVINGQEREHKVD